MGQPNTFDFVRGNRQKLTQIPLYSLGKLASLVVPRAQNRWVFGSGSGVGEGALPLYRLVSAKQPSDRLTWLVANDDVRDQAIAAGINWTYRDSWKGFWQTLRAGKIVVTHGFGDANRFGVFGGFVVQLWHGIPLKKLHLDAESVVETESRGGLNRLIKRMYRAGGDNISLFVVASDLVAERMRSAFNLAPHVTAAIGDPRDDALIHSEQSDAQAEVLRLLGVSSADSRLVLYAPTWHDGAEDPAIPGDAEKAALEEWATAHNAKIVIRPHPLSVSSYRPLASEHILILDSSVAREITPLLGAFDCVITDYSSIAFDYALTGGMISWFAPALSQYESSRGLYESYAELTENRYATTWAEVLAELTTLVSSEESAQQNMQRTERLATRLFAHRDGNAASRVLAEINQRTRSSLKRRDAEPALSQSNSATPQTIYFESFYGRQVACNPKALDAEIASRMPNIRRIWGVQSEAVETPEGAERVVIGSPEGAEVRKQANIIIVNDWLTRDFRPTKSQWVLQTWHGTMLKKLALERSGVSLRTKLAIKRESNKWSALLSQNDHCTKHLRSSYAYHGPVWQAGYPRNDSLVASTQGKAKKRLNIAAKTKVVTYAPTWRDASTQLVDELNIVEFAKKLPADWVLLVRGHSRTHAFGNYREIEGKVQDVSGYADVNDVLLASDLFVTDYSSLMFDASAANIDMAFFVPDLAEYGQHDRGFTFDFEATAPGPLLCSADELLTLIGELGSQESRETWRKTYAAKYQAWRQRYNPHDDGLAAKRVVDRMLDLGILKP